MSSTVDLEELVSKAVKAMGDPPGEQARADTTFRERFFELMVLILANLYAKTPVAVGLYDRATLLRVTTGMDDVDAGKVSGRTEDWLRIEGLLRQQDGTKNYSMTRPTLSVLCTITSHGTLGDVLDKILKRYLESMPSEDLRTAVRLLGSYFLTRVARS